MAGRLKGKVAVVIGAGQFPGQSVGTGRATALRFMEEGASVLAADRNLESACETIRISGKDGTDSEAFEADVTDSDSLRRAAEAAKKNGDVLTFFFITLEFPLPVVTSLSMKSQTRSSTGSWKSIFVVQ